MKHHTQAPSALPFVTNFVQSPDIGYLKVSFVGPFHGSDTSQLIIVEQPPMP